MLRLFRIEWNKIYFYSVARLFTIVYFVLLLLSGFILAFLKIDIGEGLSLNLAKLGMFNFPVVWQNVTYLIAIGKIFLAVIIITNVTNEYSNKTLKQNLIDGLSKKEFLVSKIITNLLLAFCSAVFVFVVCLALGLYFSPDSENLFKGIEYIGAYFIKLFFFFTLCLFFSVLMRKSAFALLSVLVWWMIEKLIMLIELLLKIAGRGWHIENIKPGELWLTEYLPLNASANLIKMPGFDGSAFVTGGSVFKYSMVEWTFVVAALIYTFLFLFLSYRLLKKRDL